MSAVPEKSAGFISGHWDSSQGNFTKSKDTKRHERNRMGDEATHGEFPRRQQLCQKSRI